MALSHDPLGPGYKEKSLQWIKVSNIFQAPSLEKTPCQKDGGGGRDSTGKDRQKPIEECKQDGFFLLP